jgi:hypothetical protein
VTRSVTFGSLALSVVAAVVVAQAPATTPAASAIPADVASLLTKTAAFTQADLDTLQAGRVITRTGASPEDLEASVVAAVRIATTKERALDYFHLLVTYVDGQVTLSFGTFGRPPSETNVGLLTLETSDVADLRACQPAACDMRVGAATPEDIAQALDWRAPDVVDRGNVWMRRGLVAYVNDYQARGDAALAGHNDRGQPIDLAAEWRALFSRSAALGALAPGVQRYFATFPRAEAPAGMTEELYWDKQHLTGLKPIIGVTHLVSQRDPATPDRAVVVQRQIFASHYLFGSLAVTLMLQDTSDVTPPATYVVYFNRSRGDLLKGTQPSTQTGLRARVSGITASLQRRVGEELIRQSADRLLGAMKQALER